MTNYTILMLPNGTQITLPGEVKPVDCVGCTYEEEITEVVDDCLVHRFTIKEELSSKALFHPCGDCCYYGDCHKDSHDCEYSYASVYTDDEILLYQKYLDTWYSTHDDGEPACINEWYDKEYQALKYMNSSRELAARILGQLELYGDFYYKLEDWLTDFLDGKEHDLPRGIEGEYLRCALRVELRDFFDNKDDIEDIESDDIEECVDRILNHCSVNVLDMDFISDIVDEYVEEKKEKRLEYLRNKAKVCPLDKEERYELDRLEGGY